MVDERFFDLRGKTEEELKIIWYLVGVSISKYRKPRDTYAYTNQWKSSSRKLVKIVKSNLKATEKIKTEESKGYRYYRLSVESEELSDSLSKFGLDNKITERTFPEVPVKYLDHLVRGFWDGNVSCVNTQSEPSYIRKKGKTSNYRYNRKIVQICFNKAFRKTLYDKLVKYAGVKSGKKITDGVLSFCAEDLIAVYRFIYRDWDFIKKHGIWVPEKKRLFDVGPKGIKLYK